MCPSPVYTTRCFAASRLTRYPAIFGGSYHRGGLLSIPGFPKTDIFSANSKHGTRQPPTSCHRLMSRALSHCPVTMISSSSIHRLVSIVLCIIAYHTLQCCFLSRCIKPYSDSNFETRIRPIRPSNNEITPPRVLPHCCCIFLKICTICI